MVRRRAGRARRPTRPGAGAISKVEGSDDVGVSTLRWCPHALGAPGRSDAVFDDDRRILICSAAPPPPDRPSIRLRSWASVGSAHRLWRMAAMVRQSEPETCQANVSRAGTLRRISRVTRVALQVPPPNAVTERSGEHTVQVPHRLTPTASAWCSARRRPAARRPATTRPDDVDTAGVAP